MESSVGPCQDFIVNALSDRQPVEALEDRPSVGPLPSSHYQSGRPVFALCSCSGERQAGQWPGHFPVQSRQHQSHGKFGSSLLHDGRTDGGYAVKVPVGSPADLRYLLYHGHRLVIHHAECFVPMGRE